MEFITVPEAIVMWKSDDAPLASDPAFVKAVEAVNGHAAYKFPQLEARMLTGVLPKIVAQSTLLGVLERYWTQDNDGQVSYANASGPFSSSGSFGVKTERKGTIYFTTDEAEILSGRSSSGAFKINLDIHPASPDFDDLPRIDYAPYHYVGGEV